MNDIKKKIVDFLDLFTDWLKGDYRRKWMLIAVALVVVIGLLYFGEEKKTLIFKGQDYRAVSRDRTVKNPYKNLAIDIN